MADDGPSRSTRSQPGDYSVVSLSGWDCTHSSPLRSTRVPSCVRGSALSRHGTTADRLRLLPLSILVRINDKEHSLKRFFGLQKMPQRAMDSLNLFRLRRHLEDNEATMRRWGICSHIPKPSVRRHQNSLVLLCLLKHCGIGGPCHPQVLHPVHGTPEVPHPANGPREGALVRSPETARAAGSMTVGPRSAPSAKNDRDSASSSSAIGLPHGVHLFILDYRGRIPHAGQY